MKRTYDCLLFKDSNEYRLLIIERHLATNIWHQNASIPNDSTKIMAWRKLLTEVFAIQYQDEDEFIFGGSSMGKANLISAIEAHLLS